MRKSVPRSPGLRKGGGGGGVGLNLGFSLAQEKRLFLKSYPPIEKRRGCHAITSDLITGPLNAESSILTVSPEFKSTDKRIYFKRDLPCNVDRRCK